MPKKIAWHCLACLLGILIISAAATAKLIEVGPGRRYAKPSEVARIAKDGDIVEIAAGSYLNDAAVWHQNNLTIRGVGGRAHIKAKGAAAEGKAIWVIKGNNTVVENMEFSGARVRDKNGAGIRQEGAGLIITRCFFHDNENGILAGQNASSHILIEHSTFAHNGAGDGQSHNIYIGRVRRFTLRYSYVHHSKIGHNVKSRARENYILYNRLMDEENGTSSYIVDICNGGTTYLIGNVMQQGPKADNYHIVAYAAEGGTNPSRGFLIVNNTFVNDRQSGVFIKNGSHTIAKLINNIFAGKYQAILTGPGELASNLACKKGRLLGFFTKQPGFVNSEQFDYRLRSSSPAVDAGSDPGFANGVCLTPQWQYVHIAGKEKRTSIGHIDIGAYEFKSAN